MKVINKTNYNILLNGYLLPPKSISIDFPDSFKDHPDFVYNLGKKYIEIYDEKHLTTEPTPSPAPTPQYKISDESFSSEIKQIDNVTFVVAGKSDTIEPLEIQASENVTSEDSLETIGPNDAVHTDPEVYKSLLTEFDTPPKISENAKLADDAIADDLSQIVKKDGKNATVVNIKKETEIAIQKATENLKNAFSLTDTVSEEFKKYSNLKTYQKRVYVSKSTNKEFLNEVVNLEKSATLKKLAEQRLKEL